MNIIDKIKALWKVKNFIDWFKKNWSKEISVDNGTKAGWKTTEFWLTVLTNLIALVSAIEKLIPVDTMIILMAVLNGVYTVLRSLVKQPGITTIVETPK